MPGYIKFSITDKKINTTLGVKSRRVFKLPDGKTVFSVLLYSGLDIVLVAEPPEQAAGGLVKQSVSIFDHELFKLYRKNYVIVMTVFEITASSYVFEVQSHTSDGKVSLGSLRANTSGVLQFNREDISAVKARRLYTKALLMEGK